MRLALSSTALLLCLSTVALAGLKDEMRLPWQRGDESFIRLWLVAGPYPCDLETDCLATQGGEANARPTDGQEHQLSSGSKLTWHSQKSWDDVVAFDGLSGPKDDAVAYAFAKVSRAEAGKVLLAIGSADGIRVWLNGKQVLAKDGPRSFTTDENQVAVDMSAGENALLIKVNASKSFSVRVLEVGTVVARGNEIGPSIVEFLPDGFILKTDTTRARSDAEAVKIEVIRPGGATVFSTTAPRGANVTVDAKRWPEGPYEIRFSTHTFERLLYVTHLPWYKGDAMVKAHELVVTAANADGATPEGFTLKMLVEMLEDRLGSKLSEAKGNPWAKIHSPLMEYEEMMLERQGKVGRIRPSGFVRLAYRDEVDGSAQYSRAYLPANYDAAKKWPLLIQLHGTNPANPVYVRWWAADSRHLGTDTGYADNQGVIYMEPHGRGNAQYLGMGDSDVVRAIAEAKRLFSVDEDRVYLTGDSMGGWGTWNVANRHPQLFAAIAPVFGGVDYHSQMSEEELAKLGPIDRFLHEKHSSWAMSEALLNVPIFVHHGDADQAVNVEWSRWGVRLLQRWGYNVRYREYPGLSHEAIGRENRNLSREWFLQQRRNPNPRHVRIRSAELRNASAYWAYVHQAASPLAFMVVDAEVVDRNVIRLDTENVLDIALSPSATLVDPSKPVKVVWNGVAQDLPLQNGELRLTNAEYRPAILHKTPLLPGGSTDFTVPFAIVIGTIAKNPEMAKLCRDKAQGVIDGWREWQRQEPRVFLDTEIADAELAQYSLLLIGGPDENRVAAQLADKVPLRISSDRINIDGHDFNVKNAAVQMLYPNPRNPERYVWIVVGTSIEGMYFSEPNVSRLYDWDYIIVDGHIPAFNQPATTLQTRVVSGMFDYNWRFSESLKQLGDTDLRSKGRQLRRPDASFSVDADILETYVGRYQIIGGPLLEVIRDEHRLIGKVGPDAGDLLPESETDYYAPKYNLRITFIRDASGEVTGLTGYSGGDFEAKKLE